MTSRPLGPGRAAAPPPARLRGVVFDLDDTLTRAGDKTELWRRTIEHVRTVLPNVDGRELRRRAGAAREAHYPEVLARRLELDAFWRVQLAEAVAPWGELPEQVLAAWVAEREADLDRRRLVTGGREIIDGLRVAGLRVGLLTNGPSRLQRHKLAATGLDRLLDAVAISEEIGVAKPDVAAFRCAAALLGCRPAETAMVGDQLEWDLEGALRAGYRLAIVIGTGTDALPDGGLRVHTFDAALSRLLEAT